MVSLCLRPRQVTGRWSCWRGGSEPWESQPVGRGEHGHALGQRVWSSSSLGAPNRENIRTHTQIGRPESPEINAHICGQLTLTKVTRQLDGRRIELPTNGSEKETSTRTVNIGVYNICICMYVGDARSTSDQRNEMPWISST